MAVPCRLDAAVDREHRRPSAPVPAAVRVCRRSSRSGMRRRARMCGDRRGAGRTGRGSRATGRVRWSGRRRRPCHGPTPAAHTPPAPGQKRGGHTAGLSNTAAALQSYRRLNRISLRHCAVLTHRHCFHKSRPHPSPPPTHPPRPAGLLDHRTTRAMEMGIAAVRYGHSRSYLAWPGFPSLFTAQKLRAKKIRRKRCELCEPDRL